MTGTGGRSAVQGKPGNWPILCLIDTPVLDRHSAAELSKAPSTSYVEGALFHSARRRQICQDRHAKIRPDAIRA